MQTMTASLVAVRAAGRRTDEDLIAAVREGDDRAFERLYGRYHRRIAAFVNGMVQDHAKSEDITQEVFVSALRRIRDTDRPINFKPWVYEIAKNACIDAFRRTRRAELVSIDVDGDGADALEGRRLTGREPTPDVAVDLKLELETLQGAFGGLSDAHHKILVMRELEGLSYKEIGAKLGMSRPSVESTLFRARRRLEEEYAEIVSGERCRRVQALIADGSAVRLGVRDEKRMARHVSYCQPCRREAAVAGFDVAALSPRPVRKRIAAWLPLPLAMRRWVGGGGDVAPLGSAAHYAEPVAGAWVKAAAAAATVALAAGGAGAATDTGPFKHGGAAKAATVVPAADRQAPKAAAASGATPSATNASLTKPRGKHAAGDRGTATKAGAGTGAGRGPGDGSGGPDAGSGAGASPADSAPGGSSKPGAAQPARDAVGGATQTATHATGPGAPTSTGPTGVVPEVVTSVGSTVGKTVDAVAGGGGTGTTTSGGGPVAGVVDKVAGTVTPTVGGVVGGGPAPSAPATSVPPAPSAPSLPTPPGTPRTGTLDPVTDTVSGLVGGGG